MSFLRRSSANTSTADAPGILSAALACAASTRRKGFVVLSASIVEGTAGLAVADTATQPPRLYPVRNKPPTLSLHKQGSTHPGDLP